MSKLKKALCVFFSVVFVFSCVTAVTFAAEPEAAAVSTEGATEKNATRILEDVSYSFNSFLFTSVKNKVYTFVPKKTGAFILSVKNKKNSNINIAIYSDKVDGQFCDGFSVSGGKELSGLIYLTSGVNYTIKFYMDSPRDVSCSFEIDNVIGKIEDIKLVSLPKKSTYIYGVDYSGSDLKLDLEGFAISASVTTLLGKKTITFTHSDFSFSSSSSLEYDHNPAVGKMTVAINTPLGSFDWDIKIINNPISKLEITKLPDKMVYDERTDGELFLIFFFHPKIDITGLEVTATYKNGTTEVLNGKNNFTSQIYSGCSIIIYEEDEIYGQTFKDTTTINIHYMGIQETFDVKIQRIDPFTKTFLYLKQVIQKALEMF